MKKIIMLLACVASTDQLHAMQSMGARAAHQMADTLKRQVFMDVYKNWKKKYQDGGGKLFYHGRILLNLIRKGAIAGVVIYPSVKLGGAYSRDIDLFPDEENPVNSMLGIAFDGALVGAFLLPAATYGAPVFYPYIIYQISMAKKKGDRPRKII